MDIFKGKTDNTIVQLFRYTFVGGFAFVVDFGLLYVLTEYAHFHYLLSAEHHICISAVVSQQEGKPSFYMACCRHSISCDRQRPTDDQINSLYHNMGI